MRRYWIEQESFVSSDQGTTVIISGDNFRHVCLVCRQDVGDQFEVLTDNSIAYKVEIVSREKKRAFAKVISERQLPEIPKPHIELCVSLPKFNKFELILEKSVELSVSKIRPFFSENSFVRSSKKLSEERLKRWHKIVMSATQQTGRGSLMTIEPPCTLDELLVSFNQNDSAAGLFPYEGDCPKTVKSELQSIKNGSFDSVWAFIGSEGGFSTSELGQFKDSGLSPVTLGEQVLRVETACVSLASIIKYELIDQ